MSSIKIKLTRGLAGKNERIKAVAHSLGLNKTASSVIVKDTPCIRGMINKIAFLLSVEEKDD